MEKLFVNAFYSPKFVKNEQLSQEQILLQEQLIKNSLSEEDVYNKICEDILLMKQSNIGKIIGYSEFTKALIKALYDSDIKATVLLGFNKKENILNLSQLENFYLKVKNLSPHINYALFITDIFDLEEQVDAIIYMANKYNLKIYVETCKTLNEVGKFAKLNNDKSPIKVLHENGLLNENTYLVHCNYLEEDDEYLIAQNKVNVIACPIFNASMGFGLINVVPLIKSGVNVSIGTNKSDNFNLKEEVKILSLFHNVLLKEANVIKNSELENLIKTVQN